MCVWYSQCPQLGHVVEAGQRYEGDVIVVEGAGLRHREGKLKAEENNCMKSPTANALYSSAIFTFHVLQMVQMTIDPTHKIEFLPSSQ